MIEELTYIDTTTGQRTCWTFDGRPINTWTPAARSAILRNVARVNANPQREDTDPLSEIRRLVWKPDDGGWYANYTSDTPRLHLITSNDGWGVSVNITDLVWLP